MKAILTLDVGTSSTKAGFYEAQSGKRLRQADIADKHDPTFTQDGGASLDADETVAEIVACIEKAVAAQNDLEIVAVALSTFWHSFVGVDMNGKAVTPISLWSDIRSEEQVKRLRPLLGDDYIQRTGCPPHTSFLPPRLLWLSEHEPEKFAQCIRFVSPGEYLYAKLFGLDKIAASISMASATGLYDQQKGKWDEKTLAHLPIKVDRLSPVDNKSLSGLQSPYSEKLAALKDIPWFPALGDGACSNLGCGAVDANRLALMIGTSGALRAALPDKTPPNVPDGLWRYQADAHRFLIGGALSNGGNVWDWAIRTFAVGLDKPEEIEKVVGKMVPDGHGLTVLPFLHGERAPLWRDHLTGTIMGMSGGTTPLDLLRAHLEAVAYRFAGLHERMSPVVTNEAKIIGTGHGLTASPVWVQMIADALGESIFVADEPQASSRGAALWAREQLGLGKIEDAEPPPIVATYLPDPEKTKVYKAAQQRQDALLARLF